MGPLEVKAGEYRGVRALCKIDPQTRIRRTHEIVTGKKLETDGEDDVLFQDGGSAPLSRYGDG